MNTKSLLLILLSIVTVGYAQNVSNRNYSFDYQMIRLDSTLDGKIDKRLNKYVSKKRDKMEKLMDVVIAYSDKELESYPLESPLSNFLTDILLSKSPKYTIDTAFSKIDISLLNFGGIRTSMPAGKITVGDMYKISPFENYLAFIVLKGSELRKALERFNDNFNAPYSGATIHFKNGKAKEIFIQNEPLNNDKYYKLVTLNFISDGGDNILKDINFQKLEYTSITFREFLILELKEMTASGKKIQADLDGRAKKLN